MCDSSLITEVSAYCKALNAFERSLIRYHLFKLYGAVLLLVRLGYSSPTCP